MKHLISQTQFSQEISLGKDDIFGATDYLCKEKVLLAHGKAGKLSTSPPKTEGSRGTKKEEADVQIKNYVLLISPNCIHESWECTGRPFTLSKTLLHLRSV